MIIIYYDINIYKVVSAFRKGSDLLFLGFQKFPRKLI